MTIGSQVFLGPDVGKGLTPRRRPGRHRATPSRRPAAQHRTSAPPLFDKLARHGSASVVVAPGPVAACSPKAARSRLARPRPPGHDLFLQGRPVTACSPGAAAQSCSTSRSPTCGQRVRRRSRRLRSVRPCECSGTAPQRPTRSCPDSPTASNRAPEAESGGRRGRRDARCAPSCPILHTGIGGQDRGPQPARSRRRLRLRKLHPPGRSHSHRPGHWPLRHERQGRTPGPYRRRELKRAFFLAACAATFRPDVCSPCSATRPATGTPRSLPPLLRPGNHIGTPFANRNRRKP
ncbi:hypothetical protein SAMN05216174_104120 [Actinokineospora iranica]|uniref:Uncharacterized protein n=1 Tax=Actinokineospora iranica TaxID=1271860 RepID=A0A1G6P6X7_9PSEU|nr:hypothetical protein SAMN05216174_104120 [Actinokineospora iranica]